MYPKPKGFTNVGIIQCFLALFFVLWFLIMPQNGKYFAWPVVPELTAMFLGAGFILRSYFGYHLWRDKYWYTLRWSLHGDYVFLGVLFVTTWWHISEMNWALQGVSDGLRIFSLTIAHVWMLAYTFEPLTIFLLHPHDATANAPIPAELSEGELQPVLVVALVGVHVGKVGHRADVGACGEGFLRAGDDDCANVLAGFEVVECGADLVHQRVVECIERLRPIQRDDADASLRGGDDVLECHGVSFVMRPLWKVSGLGAFAARAWLDDGTYPAVAFLAGRGRSGVALGDGVVFDEVAGDDVACRRDARPREEACALRARIVFDALGFSVNERVAAFAALPEGFE